MKTALRHSKFYVACRACSSLQNDACSSLQHDTFSLRLAGVGGVEKCAAEQCGEKKRTTKQTTTCECDPFVFLLEGGVNAHITGVNFCVLLKLVGEIRWAHCQTHGTDRLGFVFAEKGSKMLRSLRFPSGEEVGFDPCLTDSCCESFCADLRCVHLTSVVVCRLAHPTGTSESGGNQTMAYNWKNVGGLWSGELQNMENTACKRSNRLKKNADA